MEASEIQEIMFEMLSRNYKTNVDILNEEIEYLLRNKIDKPIKGKITKGKLRWRGIDAVVFNYMNEPIGIRQKGDIIRFVEHKNK